MGCCPSSRAQVYASEATGAEEIARLTADDSTPSSRGVQAWGAPPETPPQQASPPRRDSRRPDTEPTGEMLAAPGAEFEPEPEPQPQLEPELAPSGAGAMDEAAAGANPQSLETEAMGSPMEVECLSCFPKRSKSPVRWCAFRPDTEPTTSGEKEHDRGASGQAPESAGEVMLKASTVPVSATLDEARDLLPEVSPLKAMDSAKDIMTNANGAGDRESEVKIEQGIQTIQRWQLAQRPFDLSEHEPEDLLSESKKELVVSLGALSSAVHLHHTV